jgi:hypothetical protein
VNGRQSAKGTADDDKKQVVSANPRIPSAAKPITIRVQQQLSAPSAKPRRALDVPALRLPNPELGNNFSAPASESRNRTFETFASQPRAFRSPPPQFFRSADGTLTVKFSDGSTRVVKPGAKTSE